MTASLILRTRFKLRSRRKEALFPIRATRPIARKPESRHLASYSKMGLLKRALRLVPVFLAAALFAGCGHAESDGHDHAKVDGNGHGEESRPGASFKPGKGVIVTEETKKLLGIEVAYATERKLPNQIRLTVQVFGEKHHHLLNSEDHTGCDVHGSGFVSTNTADNVKVGQRVELLKATNSPLGGVVLGVQQALALGESEVVIGISNATAVVKPGEFVPARIILSRDNAVTAIPRSALLPTSEGTFVYVVNGNAYFRTAVKVGSEAKGWAEITEGLLVGDQVVTKPVQTLRLIELRATKGGGHCH